MHSFARFNPQQLPAADRYKLLVGLITPRPIGVISTCDAQGRHNVAPYSFFNGVGSDPMTLLFCPANNEQGEEKDSLRNAKPIEEGGSGEFVANIAPHAIIRNVVAASEQLPMGESEFDIARLTPEASEIVKPPRVAESPVAFECRTLQVVRTNPGVPAGGNVVIGEVVHVWVREGILNDRLHASQELLDTVGRLGGPSYSTTRERFDLKRGRTAFDD